MHRKFRNGFYRLYFIYSLNFNIVFDRDGRILVGEHGSKIEIFRNIYSTSAVQRGRSRREGEKKFEHVRNSIPCTKFGEAGKSWNNVNFLLVADRKKGREGGREGKTWALLFRIIYQADESVKFDLTNAKFRKISNFTSETFPKLNNPCMRNAFRDETWQFMSVSQGTQQSRIVKLYATPRA